MLMRKFKDLLWKALRMFPATLPKICFSIPASPTNGFYSQIAMFRLALDSLGGIYKRAHIIIMLGGAEIMSLPEKWKPHFGNTVKPNWVDSELFQKYGDFAQGNARFLYDYDAYDIVVFCDADTLLIKQIDDLFIRLQKSPAVIGTIAHYTFPHAPGENVDQTWRKLAKQFTGKSIELNYRHTLVSDTNHSEFPNSPFYVNFGFVASTPRIIKTIRDTFLSIRSSIIPLMENPRFTGQVAFTLSLLAHDIPTYAVGLRYNFPNDAVADKLRPKELKDIRLIHYLRTDKFDRQTIFAAEHAFKDFLSLNLNGSNKIFQRHIRKLTNGRYPF